VDENWTRPYTPGSGRWLVIAWEAIALAFLAWATVRQFELTGPGAKVVACAMAAAWVIGAHRILQMGAYVGAAGLRIHGLVRSRTLSWHDISHVRLHRATHRVGPFEIESGMTVVIDRHDGSTINTELWAKGVDFHTRPSLFRAVYQELRSRHLAACTK
jgi:PH (Pleckstrin Homology) domain-containing protein